MKMFIRRLFLLLPVLFLLTPEGECGKNFICTSYCDCLPSSTDDNGFRWYNVSGCVNLPSEIDSSYTLLMSDSESTGIYKGDFSSSGLVSVGDFFSGKYSHVRILDFSANEDLSFDEESFAGLTKLISLNVRDTKYEGLKNVSFAFMTSLKVLDASYLLLPETFQWSDVKTLEKLQLSLAPMKKLDFSFCSSLASTLQELSVDCWREEAFENCRSNMSVFS